MVGQDPRLTVSEFVAIFNQSIDMIFPFVSIVGEISNYRISKGMWVYFDLKDEESSVKFFGSVRSLPGPLEDGITCEVFGRPRLHSRFGFSVNFDQVRPVGEGGIKKARDLLQLKLEKEGLFAVERKRLLPYPPERIGLITSAESAAIADFRKIITARWPRLQIELIDTLVQGASAPAALVQAIQDFNERSNPPEVLVVIRGGGSTDDLAAFSNETVVRAIAASRLPTIVAIGHENDVSLAELAADVRASTPSNAAELLVPDTATERHVLAVQESTLHDLLSTSVERRLRYVSDQSILIEQYVQSLITNQQYELSNRRVLLQALNPLQPLEQGYALVRDAAGKHIKKAAYLTVDDVFSIQFTDTIKQARVISDE